MATPLLKRDQEDGREIPGIDSLLGSMKDVSNLKPDTSNVVENADGTADLVEPEEEEGDETEFGANLAETIEETEMETLAMVLLKKIDADKQARTKRDQQYQEGIQRTGMGGEAPGGATFVGASRAVHPMLAEGCVDFAASAMKELFPPNGPVKTKIEGEATKEKLEVAKRQERYLNWQLTEQIVEYPEELEQTLTQVPMGGSQYMKFWQDKTQGRISCEFVPIDDVFIPYSCNDFYSASRITHVQHLTDIMFDERVEDGFYRDVPVGEAGEIPETTKSEDSTMKIEGKETTPENVDDERVVLEVSTYAELSADGDERRPYLISIDEKSRKVVSIYRNWDEQDDDHVRLEWMVEYGFISWRGAYKIGLPHLIGGLSAAATGALRALLDSAHINTLPGFLRLKGARLGGQSKSIDPAQGVEVEASIATEDIRKLIVPLPYNQPSPVLFQLLGWLTDAARGVVTTAEEKISDASNQMPVGTALALIEQGSKVYSSIHARLHRSQRRALAIIARLNAKHLSVGDQIAKFGEVMATKQDFSHPLAVIPVSDPNIFSDTQRFAQMQMVSQYAFGVDPKTGQPTSTAQLHNPYKTLHRLYEIAKIPEIDEILPKPKEPMELNAAAENSAAMLGTPILAFPEQEHLAHIETHIRFMIDPFLGSSPSAAPRAQPALIEHIKQHLAFLYSQTMFEMASDAVQGDVGEMLQDKRTAPLVDKVLAAASRIVHSQMQKLLEPLGQTINQTVQKIMSMQPPPPMDPSQAAIQATKIDAQAKQAGDAMKKETEEKKLLEKTQDDAAKRAVDQQKVDIQRQAEQHRAQAEGVKTQLQAQDQQHSQALDAHQAMQGVRDQAHQQALAHQGQQHDQGLAQQGQQHDQGLAQADQQHRHLLDHANLGMQQQEHSDNMQQQQVAHGGEMKKHEDQMGLQHAQHQADLMKHDDQMGLQADDQKHQHKQANADLKLRQKESNKPDKPAKK